MCGGGSPVLNLTIYENKTTFCLQPFKMGFSVHDFLLKSDIHLDSICGVSELGEIVISTNNIIIPLWSFLKNLIKIGGK